MKTTTTILNLSAIMAFTSLAHAGPTVGEFQKLAADAVANRNVKSLYALADGVKNEAGGDAVNKCEMSAEALLRMIDKDFDPSKSPAMNVQPPSGAGWLSGGSDSAGIKDPVLRAEYEKTIAEARSYGDRYLVQSALCEQVVALLEHASLLRSHVEGARETKPEIETQLKTFVSQRKGTEAAGDVVLKWLRIRRPAVLPIDKGTSPK